MDSDFWGPHAWVFLHSVTAAYPLKPTPEDKRKYKQFFMLLKSVLPCPNCAKHFTSLSEKINIDGYLGSRDQLMYWLYLIHSDVNQQTKKYNPDFRQVIEYYLAYHTGCQKQNGQFTCKY